MIHVEKHGPVTLIRMARGFMGRPLYWTAAYLVDGLLIDAGPPHTADELLPVVEQALHGDDLRQIVFTHGHEDHIGGLAVLRQRYPAAPVYASWRTRALIEEPSKLNLQFYRRMIWGKPQPVDGVRPLDDLNNRVKTPNYLFRVVETPGHSPDHVSFFEPTQRWLFSGDAFIGGRDRAWSPEFDLFNMMGSLRIMADLRPQRLFPGSGNVRRTPQADLYEKVGYFKKLTAEVARLDGLGMSAPEIVACLFKEEPTIRLWTFGHFSAANLIEACRTYNAIFAPARTSGSATRKQTDSPSFDASQSPGSSTDRSPGHSDAVR